MKNINESIWGKILDRGVGDTIRKEDDVNLLDYDGLYDYIKSKYSGKLFYIDKDYFGQGGETICVDPIENVSLFLKRLKDGSLEHILLSWASVDIDDSFLLKLEERFFVSSPNVKRRIIKEKDGTCTNKTYIDVIDFFLEHIDSIVVNESIWGKVLDRGVGDTVRKEDMITTNKDLRAKIQELYKEQGEGDTLDVSSLTKLIKCDDFSYIFKGYKKVKHIIGLEDWDLSTVTNMSCMFEGCKNFKSDLSNWNVSSVKDMRFMFNDCENFNSDLSKWDVSKVKFMAGMFQDCYNFNCDLSKWDVSNVENMRDMFVGCKSFNSDLSKWDVSKVGNMDFMFSGCTNFNSDLSKWNVSGVKDMYHMFHDCINFNCDLSNWNVSSVEDMKDMFGGCKSLKKIPSWYMNEGLNESIWGKVLDRGAGETVRKEDEINLLDKDGLYEYLISHYKPVEYIDIKSCISCGNSHISLCVFVYPKQTVYSILLDILNCRVKVRTPYIKRWPANLLDMIDKKYNREDTIDSNRDHMTFITPKEGKGNNQFYIDFLDMILNNVDKPFLKKVINESIWGKVLDRGVGDTVRKEDEMNDDDFLMLRGLAEMFRNSIKRSRYASWRNTCDSFIKYIERRKEEDFWTKISDEAYDKVIRFVQKNWGDCTGIQEFMDKYLSNINECDGVPGGLTPADVGGMGPAYFPGPNGEPGSGDLPSPTGIVYKQVAPYTMFIKDIKKKKKKKKFRKEDEPCAHSENPPIYSHVDDFRDYVDRTYNNIDKKK